MLSSSATQMSLLNGRYDQNEHDKFAGLKKPAIWVASGLGLSAILSIPYFLYEMGHFTDREATFTYNLITNGYWSLLFLSLLGLFLLIAVVIVRFFQD
jgi:formate hydrogenlyase subunit 3/multisubunit Na+/H+ antiporter MnhD subunit